MAKRRILFLFAVILCLAAAVSIVIGCKNAVKYPAGSFDFQYDSAKVFSLGIDPYEETLNPSGLQESLGLKKYYSSLQANQFPSMIMMLLPFSLMSPMVANWVWMICNLLFSAGVVWLIKKLFFDDSYSMLCQESIFFDSKDALLWYSIFVSLLFIGLPWRNNIGNGQHTIMAFFFFLLSVYLSNKQKDISSGTALAISFFKYTLTFPLAIYFLYKKKFKTLLVSIGIHILLTIVAAIWLETSVIDMIIKPLKISSRFTSEGFLDIGAIFGFGKVGMIIILAVILVMIVYVMSGMYKGTDNELLSLLVLVSLVATYHRPYDYFVLIIPVIVFSFKKKDALLRICIWAITLYSFVISKALMVIGIPSRFQHYTDFCFAIILYVGMIISVVKPSRLLCSKKKYNK